MVIFIAKNIKVKTIQIIKIQLILIFYLWKLLKTGLVYERY